MDLKRAFLSTSAIVVAVTGVEAAAQEQPTDEGRLLDEIVVTAQKKSENQQDVPISIATFTGDALDALGINQSNDLGEIIPGLEISTSSGDGSQLIVFLRGAGLNDFNTNNAGPIGIYSDEAYISSPILTSFQFFDTERLEVLKGPQGTLYGRNTTGGAIRFISNKPTDEFDFRLRANYGNFDSSEIEAAISGPITDRVRARAAVSKVDSDGFVENLVNGESENGADTLSWRGIVDIDVTDNFTLRSNIHGAHVNQDTFRFNHLGILPGGVDVLGYSGPEDIFTGEYNRDIGTDIDNIGGYIEANIDFGSIRLTTVSAFDDVDSTVQEETDASPLDLIFVDFGVESQTFTQEIRFSGTHNRFEWQLGGFYLTEDLTQNQTIDLFRELRVLTGGLSDPFGVTTGGAAILLARVLNEQETDTFAVFGQTDVSITDRLTVTLGGRYTNEERRFDALGTLEDDILFGPDGLVIYDFDDLELDDGAFSWRFGADYKATDDILLFASVSRGFKSGGFNGGFLALDPIAAAEQVQPYEPEFLTAYELGIKSDFFDDRLRLNASVFFNDFKDLQVFTLVNTDALPIQVLDNSSGAEVFGFEFDVLYYPIDNLLLNVTGAILDSELTDFMSDTGADFSGNRIAFTPKTSITALARYDHEISDNLGSLYIQASAAYKSDQFFSTENNPLIGQEGYTIVNARVGYQHPSNIWEAAFFVNNLGDEEYFTNAFDLSDFGFVTRIVAPPRTFGGEITLTF
ncbi:MAG: TonB-dependent receptor [Pseudomonadota bacterium]